MTRRLAVIALLAATAGLASCDRLAAPADPSTTEDATAAPDPGPASSTRREEDPSAASLAADPGQDQSPDRPGGLSSAGTAQGGTAIEGAPAFAVIFPGATVEPTPLLTRAPGGAGGGVVFSSEASPDDIVRFYRQGAEAAGMTQVMAMNNGNTRAYSATKGPGGASLTIVAHPVEEGQTSAQLTWTVGP